MAPSSGPPNSGPPTPTSFSDVLLRIMDHWFAPTAHDWHWTRRLAFTAAGSATFFFAWFIFLAPYGVILQQQQRETFYLVILGFAVPGTLWFAGLTAWKDLNYGPARLYLSGFLLPYFVWTLISFMLTRTRPELGI